MADEKILQEGVRPHWVLGLLFDQLLTTCVNVPCVSFAELRY